MSDKKINNTKQNNHTSQFSDLRKKYTLNVKSSFPIETANYDKNDVNRKIDDIKKAVEEQIALSIKLDNNVEERIEESKKFMDENEDIIENQFNTLCELEQQLYNLYEET